MRSSIQALKNQSGRFIVMALVATSAIARGEIPVLSYDPPKNFYRSAITPPEDYSSNEVNATLQVYPFRPFSGNIEQMFQRTLLREWIDRRFQEANVAGPPDFKRVSVPGAQFALMASFADNPVGIARPRVRMVIVAGGAAAIVDASAIDAMTWQHALPAFNAVAASLRVDAGGMAPSMTEGLGPAGRAVAGLYMGRTPKDAVDLNRAVPWNMIRVPALHYYLFSQDGRVYRAYDNLSVPGGNISRFDFDAAQYADPVNSGRYTLKGSQLRIQMGGQSPETITTAAPRGGAVTIENVDYVRQ